MATRITVFGDAAVKTVTAKKKKSKKDESLIVTVGISVAGCHSLFSSCS